MARLKREQLEANIEAMEKQGASQGEIQEYLDSLKTSQPEAAPEQQQTQEQQVPQKSSSAGGILTRAATNLLPSGARAVGDILGAVIHPIQTLKGLASAGAGAVEKLIPGEQKHEASADAVADFYKERYGSMEKVKETFATDPVGFLMDASVVLGGGAAGFKAAGALSKSSRVTRAGEVISKAGAAIDPIQATGRLGAKVTGIGKATDEAAEIAAAAKRTDTKITAGMATGSRAIKGVEGLATDAFVAGKSLTKVDDAARANVTAFADDLVKHAGPEGTAIEIGQEFVKAQDGFTRNWIEAKNALYKDVKIPATSFMDPAKTRGLVTALRKQQASATNILGETVRSATLDNIYNSLFKKDGTPKKVRVRDMQNAVKQMNELLTNSSDPFVTGNKGALIKLTATMSDEFTASLKVTNPEAAAKLEYANSYYKEGLDVINSRVSETIKGLEANPSQILESLVKGKTSVEDIQRLEKIAGSELMPHVQKAVIDDIITAGRSKATIEGFFTPAGIKRGMVKYGDKLDELLAPEQIQALTDIDVLAKALKASSKSTPAQLLDALRKLSPLLTLTPGGISWVVGAVAVLGRETVAALIANKTVQAALVAGDIKAFGKVDVADILQKMQQPAFQAGRLDDFLPVEEQEQE